MDQELKHIWKHFSENQNIQLDMKQLLRNFKSGMESRERIVRRRDRREIAGAIMGMLFFGYALFVYPYPVSKAGSVLGLISLCYLIYKLRSNRKSKYTQELFLSLKEELKNQKQFMLNQARLLNTVLYWMILPLFLAHVLFIWGIAKTEQPITIMEQLAIKWEMKLISTLVIGLLYGYIVWMNKRAAIVNWGPLLKQVENIQQQLKNE